MKCDVGYMCSEQLYNGYIRLRSLANRRIALKLTIDCLKELNKSSNVV